MLSTCNRTEVYAVAERFHGAYADVRNFLAETAFLAPEDFADHLYVHYDREAIRHLFTVAAGLDSAVLGESEILGQVSTAWERAKDEGAAGPDPQPAVPPRHRGRQAGPHRDRHRPRHRVGVHAAVEMAADRARLARRPPGARARRRRHGRGHGRRAGQRRRRPRSSSPTAPGTGPPTLADRVDGRGRAAVATCPPRWPRSTCCSPPPAPPRSCSSTPTSRRSSRPATAGPLLIVDIAVPRDVDPSVADLPGVTLLDMDDLRRFAAGRRAGARARGRARSSASSTTRSTASSRPAPAAAAAPLVAALHARAEELRQAELERFRSRLGTLDPRQRAAVEALTKGLVAKVLHEPTVRLKDAAGTPKGERLAEALRDLFDLE